MPDVPEVPKSALWPVPAGLDVAGEQLPEEMPPEVRAMANNALGDHLFGGVELRAWCQPGHRVGVYVGADPKRGGWVIFVECPVCDAGETTRYTVLAQLIGSCEAASRPLRFERGNR